MTASNSTQLHDKFEMVIILWYTAVGICGLIGNCFVIAVITSRCRQNSSYLMIIWLGCTDLISCLILPLRYKIFHQVMTLSPSLCGVGQCIVIFLSYLNINSLGMVAIERHKAVRNINRNEHLSCRTVRALVVLCILTSVVFTIPTIWFVMNDSTRCSKLESLNIYEHANLVGFVVPVILTTVSNFILIIVLYIKICILVRARVGLESNSNQQLRKESSLSKPVRPTDEGTEEHVSIQWTREQINLCQVTEDAEEHNRRAADVVSCHFVDLKFIEETQSQFPKDAASLPPSISMISGASHVSRPPQSGRESSASSYECHLPGPSTSSLHQIPGVLMDGHDTERQIPAPIMHSTTIQADSYASKNEEPATLVLNNQHQYNIMVSNRVTCMLFIVTLVYFGTYFITSIMLFFPYGLAIQVWREFLLINHVINPVVYSIANEWFRQNCISFLQKIREKLG